MLDPTPDPPLAPGLYLVSTPIGNLEDITLRALRILRSADRIACEDTRQTQKLLHHFGIATPAVSYHLHNEQSRTTELLDQLRNGARLALVSDAGTPAIADPGEAITRAAIEAGIPVFPVPGASAVLSALVASGLLAERFTFNGFLPSRAGERRSTLEALRETLRQIPAPATHIFYETPHRILDTLRDLLQVFGPDHAIALARELTKLHEEFLRGPTQQVLAQLETRPSIRGEFVLLLDGSVTQASAQGEASQTLAQQVRVLLQGGLTEKDALKQVARSLGLGKSEAYREWQRTRSRS